MKNKKTILITGGTGGIGSEIVKSLIKDGHKVIVWSTNKKNFIILQKSVIIKKNLSFKKVDISNLNQVKKASKEIKKIDVLINAAAVLWPVKPFIKTDLEEIRKSLEISMWGTINCCYYLLSKLPKKGGKIINFSGGGSANGRKNHMAYSLAKTSLVRFTENLALENPELYINIISPGAHKTNMWKDEKEKEPDKWADMQALLNFINFLISDESNGISGKFINYKDNWTDISFIKKVKDDCDFLTLRRIDDYQFTRKIIN